MKKLITVLMLMILASASAALQAEEKSTSFWDAMRKKIETIAPKKQLGATTAVGGVRGAAEGRADVEVRDGRDGARRAGVWVVGGTLPMRTTNVSASGSQALST